jgi:hypothetical protein
MRDVSSLFDEAYNSVGRVFALQAKRHRFESG